MDIPGTKNNLFSIVLCQHGREVLKTLRNLENTVRKLARWTNHRTFNIKCAKANIIPVSIKLATNVPGVKAEKVLAKAERKLLDIRIRQSAYTINQLKKKETELKVSIYTIVNEQTKNEIQKLLDHAYKTVSDDTRSRQQQKFNNLVEKKRKHETTGPSEEDIDTNRWVINNSKRGLSPTESSVLKKGLNFAITPTKLPINDIIAQTESAARKLPPTAADSLRSEVVRAVKNAKLPPPNITKDERKALFELKKDKDIIILPADKGRATVILDTADYKAKVTELLADTSTYIYIQN
jgi:hypothetical protein